MKNQDTAMKKMEERKHSEKEKIKDQYESYRKMKTETDETARSDSVKRAEENLDDIRSLLTSIQSAPK